MEKIQATEKWFQSIVLGQKLCPFAPPLRLTRKPLLRICSSSSSTLENILDDMAAEAQFLIPSKKETTTTTTSRVTPAMDITTTTTTTTTRPDTTLVVLDMEIGGGDFREFVRLSWEVQQKVIWEQGLVEQLQLVVFHPCAEHVTYSSRDEEDAGDYTIRSPYPTFHLLRETDVYKAVQSYKDISQLPTRNKEKLRTHGIAKCQSMLQQCYTRNPKRKQKDHE